MIDVILLAVLGVVAYMVAEEGIWGAIINFFIVVFAGLLAMDLFEPLAAMIGKNMPAWNNRADFIALIGLFAILVGLGRWASVYLSPAQIEINSNVYQVGRWIFGLATGYVTMAIFLTSLHTANLPRNFWGFEPERKNFFGIASPDRQWLAFTQHFSEDVCNRNRPFDVIVYPVPGTNDEAHKFKLATFPIKYATRRQLAYGGGTAGTPIPVAPQGGGGGGAPPPGGGNTPAF